MSEQRVVIRPATIVLVLVGVVLVAIAVVYFAERATDLPSFLPGHQSGVTKHHTKHGVALLGVAVVVWIGAWFTTSPTRG